MAGRGCPRGRGASGARTGQTSVVPPGPAGASSAPPPPAGASPLSMDPVPPPPGAVPVSVVIAVSVGPSFHRDVLLVHCLLLLLALLLLPLPLLWTLARTPPAAADHGAGWAGGLGGVCSWPWGWGRRAEACPPALAGNVGLVCWQLFGDLYIKGAPHYDSGAPPHHCPHPTLAWPVPSQPAGSGRASHPCLA